LPGPWNQGRAREALLGGLIAWCQRRRIPEFIALAKTLKRFRPLIWNTRDHAVSNGRAEGSNTQLAALTARARGFHRVEAFIAMAELTCGGLCPDLPGRGRMQVITGRAGEPIALAKLACHSC
jgi:transposase